MCLQKQFKIFSDVWFIFMNYLLFIHIFKLMIWSNDACHDLWIDEWWGKDIMIIILFDKLYCFVVKWWHDRIWCVNDGLFSVLCNIYVQNILTIYVAFLEIHRLVYNSKFSKKWWRLKKYLWKIQFTYSLHFRNIYTPMFNEKYIENK